MTIAWIPLWAAALLLLPGWVILRLAGPRGIPGALQIAPSFALSLAVIALISWSGYVLGFGFSGVKTISIAVVVLCVLALPVAIWHRRPATGEPVLPGWALWAASALALGAGLAALYSGPWLSATADTFYHLAAIWSVMNHGTPLPQEVFFSTAVPNPDPTSGAWHVAVALVSNLSGQDPVTVWRVMTVAVAPLLVLAFFALALAITRNGVAALIACALYVVLALSFDFRTVAYPNQSGNISAWLALAFVLRFAEYGSRRELVVAAAIAFGASAIHPLLSPFLLAATAGGLAAAIIVRSPHWRRLALAVLVIGLASLPLVIVNVLSVFASSPYAAMAVPSGLPLRVIHHPWTWVWPSNWYNNPGAILGTAFAVSLVRLWRTGQAGAGLLLAVLVAIPAVALTPLFATSYGRQYLLARISFVLLPLAWVAWGWALTLAIGALRSRWMVPAAAVLVISMVAIGDAFYTGPLARYDLPATSAKSLLFSRSTDLTVAWRDRLAAIEKLPRSAIVLAEPRMAYELAGLTGIEVVAVPYSHTPAQVPDGPRRREDAVDAVQGRLDSFSLAGVIEHYGVTDVLVDTDRTNPQAWAQLASAEILTPIASGAGWRLYRYDRRGLDSFLDLPTQQEPGPALLRSGIGPQQALAGRSVFARLQWNQGAAGTARLQADGLDATYSFSQTFDVGGSGSSETAALPIPLDASIGQYRLSLVMSGGQPVPLGEFEVGHLYQAEDMGGVGADSNQWTVVGGGLYQGALAAGATKPGATMHQTIPPIGAGAFCVAARVYDYGTGQSNTLEVTLGGTAARMTWAGSAPVVRWLRTPMTLAMPAGQVGIRLIQRGQAAAVVDALEIYPLVEGACTSD